ncbi:TPA: YfbM family protein [Escherichia coli]|nr:YfbM family protein [Escherichia coli]
MGMIGYFAEIDSEKINQLLESTEKPLMDNIHDTLSGLRRLDIDKRWDFLHFGLTGTSAFDPAKNDPLSRAVLGEHSLEDGIDGFLGLTWNQELAATIDRLESLDRSELLKQFSIKRLNEMEIYPGVTFSEELEGQLFASIMLDMEKLISAYRRMLRQGNHALTVIVG